MVVGVPLEVMMMVMDVACVPLYVAVTEAVEVVR